MNRTAAITRSTAETAVTLSLNLDGTGDYALDCPVGFLGHLLDAFCKHGLFDLSGSISGDLHVDQHHLVEDTGIVLGTAFSQALGDHAGIYRVGSCLYPMDETLARAAVDFGGRGFLVCEAALSGIPLVSAPHGVSGPGGQGGGAASFQTDTFTDFWQGFVSAARCALHLDVLRGRSDHHKMEALFKAASRAMRDAVTIDLRRGKSLPSTKGVVV
jgi:imidazoleglycerol-phosphate dehydratase